MDIWKVNDFNFLNEEAEEFSNRWSRYLVNVRSPSYLKKKPSNIVCEAYIIYLVFHSDMVTGFELTFQ